MSGIFERIVSAENLFAAWREFRRGKRDKLDVHPYERHLEDSIFRLRDDLACGRYQHGPYQEFVVHDPKRRVIHKASVRDRVVHQAIVRVLQALLEHSFIHDSYSCRTSKGPHAAVRRLEIFARSVSRNWTQPTWALKLDIAQFFGSIDHEILHEVLARTIPCSRTVRLVGAVIGSYRRDLDGRGGATSEDRPTGLPLGSVTSQLFANAYLDALDHSIKEQLHVRYYLRYADDLLFLAEERDVLERFLLPIQEWLWRQRRLTLHPRKVIVRKLSHGVDFLGYVVLPHYTVLRTRTKRRMIRRLNLRNVHSYLGLLRHCAGQELRRRLVKRVFQFRVPW